MFDSTPITMALALATLLNIVVSLLSWQRRHTESGKYFSYAMLGITLWTLAAGLRYAVTSLSYKIFFATLETWGYMTAMPLMTLSAMSFAGRGNWARRPWVRLLFLLFSASTILLVNTNSLHGWVWSRFIESNHNIVIFEHGPAFGYIMLVGYAMIVIILVQLLGIIRKGSRIARRQGWLLLSAATLPLAANIIYHFSPWSHSGIDWTSVTYSVTGVIYLWALNRAYLFDIIPIARQQLFENLRDGMIALNTVGEIADINAAAAHMLNASPGALIGKSLTALAPNTAPLLESCPETETRAEFKIESAPQRCFDLLISPIQDKYAVILGRLLIFRDISRIKENELRLLQLTQAVEQSPISVIITDLKGNIQYANPKFSELTGYTHQEALGRNASINQSGQTPRETYTKMWQSLLAGQIWHGEFLNRKKNGELYWEEAVIGPVTDESGNVLNFIATKVDITLRKQSETALRESNILLAARLAEIESLQAHLQEQVIRDPLTKLHNRRFLNETIQQEFLRAERNAQSISIILLDIDHFKSINDKYGHSAGDACLLKLADILLQSGRRTDITCRYGGEEFIILLPDTPARGARQHAEDLRQKVARAVFTIDDRSLQFTISLGIATFPQDGEHFTELIQRADESLYASKRRGRNRTTAWADAH